MDDASVRCWKLLIILITVYNEKIFIISNVCRSKLVMKCQFISIGYIESAPHLILIILLSVFHWVNINHIDCPLPGRFRHSLCMCWQFVCFFNVLLVVLMRRKQPTETFKDPLNGLECLPHGSKCIRLLIYFDSSEYRAVCSFHNV